MEAKLKRSTCKTLKDFLFFFVADETCGQKFRKCSGRQEKPSSISLLSTFSSTLPNAELNSEDWYLNSNLFKFDTTK